MKLKHTKNGNVKITMSIENAERLRSTLMEAQALYTRDSVSHASMEVADGLDDLMGEAGICYKL